MNSDFTPGISESNPGMTTQFSIDFSNEESQWTETFNLSELLLQTKLDDDLEATFQDDWLCLSNGYWLLPRIGNVNLDSPGAQTMTTIQIAHEELLPDGVFEYQHSASNQDVQDAIQSGFESWWQGDYPVLADAISEEPSSCHFLEMSTEGNPGMCRRVILGPPAHYFSQEIPNEEEHPFCPCCLVTNSFEGFQTLFESEETCAMRLFVCRNDEGIVEADCRVNGEDWDEGRDSLVKYGETWPDRGFEFRKQYCLFKTITRSHSNEDVD